MKRYIFVRTLKAQIPKSLILVAMPGAPSSFLLLYSSFLLLVVRPGAPSSVLAPSSGFGPSQYPLVLKGLARLVDWGLVQT